MKPEEHNKLLTPMEVSKILGVTVASLCNWRHQTRATPTDPWHAKPKRLPYYRLGNNTVRYRLADVLAFLAENRHE